MKKKAKWVQRIFLILSVVWMVVIFVFSAQNGEESSKTSGKVVDQVAPIVVPDYNKLSDAQKIEKKQDLTFLVRKLSHLFEYVLLGMLLSFALPFDRIKRLISSGCAFGIAVLYAMTDEVHQIFSGGRSPAIRDVLIDSAGALIGVLCACLILWIAEKWINRKKKDNTKKSRTRAA